MAKVFLDANIVIDFLERKQKKTRNSLKSNLLYITPLSIHILLYTRKKTIPYDNFETIENHFAIVDFNKTIMNNSFIGPTTDFEDNVQLHSAQMAGCDIFLTSDKSLLKMKSFGKMSIKSSP